MIILIRTVTILNQKRGILIPISILQTSRIETDLYDHRDQ